MSRTTLAWRHGCAMLLFAALAAHTARAEDHWISPAAYPEPSALSEQWGLNELAVEYARGQQVARNPRLALRIFQALALQGYTPAMVNLGLIYERGLIAPPEHRLAVAWITAALALGVPESLHEETVSNLGIIVARLGTRRARMAKCTAYDLAAAISVRNDSPIGRLAAPRLIPSEFCGR